MYRFLLRPLLFLFPAEQAHKLVLSSAGALCALPFLGAILRWLFSGKDQGLARRCFSLTFPNPVGLAAGMDKDARYLWLWWVLGFGFVEVGSITPLAQAGNPLPRLFRLPKQKALINQMGFNNEGMHALKKRLMRRRPPHMLIGINLGKQASTPLKDAANDYLKLLAYLYPLGDYFVVNISSPNTPSLTQLQRPEAFYPLLESLVLYAKKQPETKPLLVKLSPDLDHKTLEALFQCCVKVGVSGLILTNTSVQRNVLYKERTEERQVGGGL